MSLYLAVKLLHILSSTILFGTGIGTAFFMVRGYLSRAMANTVPSVVLADWLFTTPAMIIQLVSGIWLTHLLGISFSSTWFVVVMILFMLVGACWIPVVWIQIKIRALVRAGADRNDCKHLMRAWASLGVPAFLAVVALFYLMVTKTGAYGGRTRVSTRAAYL